MILTIHLKILVPQHLTALVATPEIVLDVTLKLLATRVTERTSIPDDESNNASTSTKILSAKIPNICTKRDATKSKMWDHFRVLIDDSSGKTHECMHCPEDHNNFKFYYNRG